MLIAFVLLPDILETWINTTFAERSSSIMRWISIGVIVNAVAQVPFAYIQAVGRADLSGRLHLAELPVYLLALWLVLRYSGLDAVAVLWTVRASVDALIMFYLAHRAARSPHTGERRALWSILLTLVPPILWIVLISDTPEGRVIAFRSEVADLRSRPGGG